MTDEAKRNTVLIIEDEEDIRNLVSRVLGLEGYIVLAAGSGETGLEIARSNKISLLILDLKLPGMDGWGVIKEMRKDTSLAEVPIVLFTASVNAAERARAQNLTNVYYLPKPVNSVTLVETIKRILK